MAQVINTNIMSLNAQRNLNKSQLDMTQALQRLSSGLRINSAKDDAAGLAIATRMTTQIGGLSVAMRNANDGISIAQTAEGTMSEMTTALNRMHDLAVQAASYNANADRQSLNNEVSQFQQELSRIVAQTRYNGLQLLTGNFSADIQVGSVVGETINIAVSDLSPTSMGVATNYSTITGLADAALATRLRYQHVTDLDTADTINGIAVGTTVAANSNSSGKITAINSGTSAHGVSAFNYGNSAVGATDVTDANLAATAVGAGELVINGTQIGAATGLTALAAAINTQTSTHGVTAAVEAGTANADDNRLVLFNTGGAAIEVTVNSANAATVTGFASGSTSVGAAANGLIVLNQDLTQTTVTLNDASAANAMGGVNGAAGVATTYTLVDQSVSSQNVNTAASANLAMLAFEAALDEINDNRSILGAKMNRMDSLIRNLDNVRENISAARSRIQDADFAAETAALTRAQILQQAGVAMVSQANALPQTVLSLLQ